MDFFNNSADRQPIKQLSLLNQGRKPAADISNLVFTHISGTDGRQQWQNRGLESGVRSAAAAAAAIYMHATAAAAAAGAAACLLSACVIELEQNKERRSRVG